MEFKKREVKRTRPPSRAAAAARERRKSKVDTVGADANGAVLGGDFYMILSIKGELFEMGEYDRINLQCPIRSMSEFYNMEYRRKEYKYKVTGPEEAQILNFHWRNNLMKHLNTSKNSVVSKKMSFQYKTLQSENKHSRRNRQNNNIIEEPSDNTCTSCQQNRKG